MFDSAYSVLFKVLWNFVLTRIRSYNDKKKEADAKDADLSAAGFEKPEMDAYRKETLKSLGRDMNTDLLTQEVPEV